MSLKIKLATGASLAALVLLFGAIRQRCARHVPPSESPAAGAVVATVAVTPTASKRPPSPPRLLPDSAPTPDRELVVCENELKERLATDLIANFTFMRPSTKNQNLIAPLVERVVSRFQPKPSYSLECRVSSCRVVAVGPDESTIVVWLDALVVDRELGARGIVSKARMSRPFKDVLTGARDTMVEHYLSVPFRTPASPEESHPYDTAGDPPQETAPASLAGCRNRIAAMDEREQDQARRRAEVAGIRSADVGVTVGIELTPQERKLLKAAHDRFEARSGQVSREILADLKGTGAAGLGEISKEERRELFDLVIREQDSSGGLREGKVSAIIKRHKRDLARYWRETLENVLPAERAREILQASREGRIGGLSVRPPILGENPKGERMVSGWAEEDWW